MRKLIYLLRSTRGSAESAMVLIPLLILFLVGMQISIAVHQRNIVKISVQDEASKRAISGSFEYGDEFMHIDSSGDNQNLDLVIVRRESRFIDLVSHFLEVGGNAGVLKVNGFAVIENQR